LRADLVGQLLQPRLIGGVDLPPKRLRHAPEARLHQPPQHRPLPDLFAALQPDPFHARDRGHPSFLLNLRNLPPHERILFRR
jgi:hypothetical protein